MSKRQIDRREFVREGSALVAAAAAAGNVVGADAAEVDTKKIVNYNPKMRYRRLGKSNLMFSEVSLGGHWKNRGGGRYWGDLANDQVPDDVAKNRADVISACADCGINYLDITTPAECCDYGVALKGRREKMHVGADDYRNQQGNRHPVRQETGGVGIWLRSDDSDRGVRVEIFEHENPTAFTGSLGLPGRQLVMLNLRKDLFDAGGWNTLAVEVRGSRAAVWLNGAEIGAAC